MNKNPHYNQQTGAASLKLRKYVFTKNLETDHHSIYIWKEIVGSMLERIPLKQHYLKVVTFSNTSFTKKRIYVYDHAA